MMKPIVVVGSINLDLVARANRIPAPGETLTGTSFQTFFGGKGANQAVAAAKAGGTVRMIGCVGTDAFGAQLQEGLRAAGVDVDGVSRVDTSSGVALITTDAAGENSIVVIPGANGLLTPETLAKHETIVKEAGVLLSQLEIPVATVELLADYAARYDIPLILDPAPAQELPSALLARCVWITPNETEAAILCGSGHATGDEAEIVHTLRRRRARNLILKQGARGVLVAEEDHAAVRVPGFPVKAIDTTAAGDAFNGAFAVARMRGQSVAESARFANAVAAISVTRHGAQPSMPSAAEVEQFLADSRAL